MPASKNQNYLHGAAILTIAVVIVKILGAIYKIPMANIMDNKGFAHFNVAHNLYAVLLTLSTAGLPVALSKMISESNSLNRPVQIQRTFKVALISFVVLGTIGSAIMFLFPTELAVFMEDVEASQSMFALAPSVVLVCIMSAFRGHTQGLSDMTPTSVSQVIEVAVKVAFGIALMLVMKSLGASTPLLSAAAVSGVSVGSFVACIYMGVVSVKRMRSDREYYLRLPEGFSHKSDSEQVIFKRLLRIGIPIALGSSVLSVITLANTKIILGQLQNSAGFNYEEATNLFGIYSKTLPLFNLPAAIITPMTISIVPAIAGFLEHRQGDEAKEVVESSLRIATIIALPMAIGLSVMAEPIMHALFGRPGEGVALLVVLGLASYFVCLSLMTTAILQASGRERLPMYTMLIGGALNIGLIWVLVGKPSINIYGAVVGTAVCYLIISVLNLWFVSKKLPQRPKLSRVFVMPILNCAAMGLTAWLVYPAALGLLKAGPEPSRMIAIAALTLTISLAVLVYLVLTVFTRAITVEDMKLIPKGEKLARLLRIK